MQYKGFVRFFAIVLTLICLFYLSFTVVCRYYENQAAKYAGGAERYLDSMSGEKVWLNYTLQECREQELNLGLDLRGGMNVVMEVSVPDILKTLAGENDSNPLFIQTLNLAKQKQLTTQKDFVDLFHESFMEINPNGQLSSVFSSFELRDKINSNTTNTEVLKVLKEEVKSAVDNSFNVLRSRIDRFGVVQPNIQQLDIAGRILIEMPGIKEPERVRKLLQGSANLEFWETYNASEIMNSIFAVNDMAKGLNSIQSKKDTLEVEKVEVVEQTPGDTLTLEEDLLTISDTDSTDISQSREQFAKENPLFAILNLSINEQGQVMMGPLIGTANVKDTAQISYYMRLAQERGLLPLNLDPKWTVKPIVEGSKEFALIALNLKNRDQAPLSGSMVTSANVDFDPQTNSPQVSMRMNPEGAKIWANLTRENIGKSVAIVLDGYVYSYPTVQSEIPNGTSSISGNFTTEEAQDLVNVLKSGKMSAPARIVQEDVVGPSLGNEAIQSGMISFIIAFVMVLLYMIFYYGLIPGLVADAALFANVFFIFGVLASFQAVLTLPGIAGIVLTLGMAVDANVLVYERIREELRAGKMLKKAVADGYSNALSAILDSNITTLIAGFVLFYFGTGPIRGFATTLIIGIACSLFTALFLTRLIYDRLLKNEKYHNIPFVTKMTKNWLQNAKFDFIGKRKTFYTIAVVLSVLFIGSLATLKLKQGIDFSGGRNYIVRFEQPVNTSEISELLSNSFDGESVSVITLGSSNQVRISTNYKIEDNSESVDGEIMDRLYTGLQSVLNNKVTADLFVSSYSVDANGDVVSASGQGESFGIQSSQKVGPTMADDIKESAIWAVIIVLFGIGLYILIRFRNIAFSLGAIIALAFDTLLILGLYSLLYSVMPFSLEIDQSFIAAILTVIGYSINDKVVIFDRIRENIKLYPARKTSLQMNDAINATLSRTFSTYFSTLVVLIIIFFFGGNVIRGFIFAMLVGVLSSVYSTLFIASPLAYDFLIKLGKKDKKEIAE
jgi:SecD/SecF fusion protein